MTAIPAIAPLAQIAPPAPVPAPALFTKATGRRHVAFDAFYRDERNLTIAKATHPVKSFYNVHTVFNGSQGYATAEPLTSSALFANPLNDPTVATVLPQTFAALGTTSAIAEAHFKETRPYFVFVPKRLKDAFDAEPAASEPKARVCLYFGVGPEFIIFGLRNYFADSNDCVLITIPGVEAHWTGYGKAWGIGITTAMIATLLLAAGLPGIAFTVEVMAGYSTGYRGLNLTIINRLVALASLRRVVYLDAFYQHDDFPQPPTSHAYHRRLTTWAVDTAVAGSANAEVAIYAVTHPGGVPRNAKDEPTGPLDALVKTHLANIRFLDLEFARGGKPAIADTLERICLARLVEAAIDDYVESKDVPAEVLRLVTALPARGSLGVLGRSGFTDLYAWAAARPQAAAIAAFPATRAFEIVTKHQLLGGWTTSDQAEFRHRDFVQEIGKEALLP